MKIGGISLVVSFAISYAIYRLVEKPAAELRKRGYLVEAPGEASPEDVEAASP